MKATRERADRSSTRAAPEPLNDNQLVERYLAGEEEQFRELVERYEGRIINFIQRSIGDRERAYDLAQETFIRVYRHLDRFDQEKKFSTWIYTIASNLAKNELRNRSRNPVVLYQTLTATWEDDHRPLQFEDSSMKPDDMFRKRHLAELVERAAEELPDHHRESYQADNGSHPLDVFEKRVTAQIVVASRCAGNPLEVHHHEDYIEGYDGKPEV